MGQYFKYVNADKQEWCALPGGAKLPEIIADPKSCQIMAYLLVEGPFDGTTCLDRLYDVDDEKVAEATAEYIEREEEREKETGREPINRNDGEWDYERIKKTVAASFVTGDDAICGRWAGDDVTLIGDYAERDLYDAMYGNVVVQLDSGELVSWHGRHPRPVEQTRSGTRRLDEDAEPGDEVRIRTSVDADDDFGEFVRYEETEWTNITEDVYAEMARYMPDQFGELADDPAREVETQFGSGVNA